MIYKGMYIEMGKTLVYSCIYNVIYNNNNHNCVPIIRQLFLVSSFYHIEVFSVGTVV